MGCNSQRNPKDSRCHLSLRAVSGQPFARRANINRKLWTVSRDWRYGNRGWTRAPYRPCEFVSRRRRSEKNWSSTTLWPWGADITLAWDNLANLAPAFASGRAGAVPGYRANCTTKRQRRGRGRLAQG